MSDLSDTLSPTLDELQDTLDDLRTTPFQSSHTVLQRLIGLLDVAPMGPFLSHALPAVNFETWWLVAEESTRQSSLAGSGRLDWPHRRAERVAMQIALVRRLASGEIRFLDHLVQFHDAGRNDIQAHIGVFADRVVEPLLRDLGRLSEARVIPPGFAEAVGGLPGSGDDRTDELLMAALRHYRDPSRSGGQLAAEKLWDAWERLKTLDDADKRRGSKAMLDQVADEPTLRNLLETEALALTKMGNEYQIRHFETDKIALRDPAQLDYLFLRLLALIHLVLVSRGRS